MSQEASFGIRPLQNKQLTEDSRLLGCDTALPGEWCPLFWSIILPWYSGPSSSNILPWIATRRSWTLGTIHTTTGCHSPRGLNLQQRSCENLVCHKWLPLGRLPERTRTTDTRKRVALLFVGVTGCHSLQHFQIQVPCLPWPIIVWLRQYVRHREPATDISTLLHINNNNIYLTVTGLWPGGSG